MDVLKRKRSEVQNNNYEDSYTRYNDWKTKSIKDHINHFININKNNNNNNNNNTDNPDAMYNNDTDNNEYQHTNDNFVKYKSNTANL